MIVKELIYADSGIERAVTSPLVFFFFSLLENSPLVPVFFLFFFEHYQEHWLSCKTRIWASTLTARSDADETAWEISGRIYCGTHTTHAPYTHTHPATVPSGEIPRCGTHGRPDWESNRGAGSLATANATNWARARPQYSRQLIARILESRSSRGVWDWHASASGLPEGHQLWIPKCG